MGGDGSVSKIEDFVLMKLTKLFAHLLRSLPGSCLLCKNNNIIQCISATVPGLVLYCIPCGNQTLEQHLCIVALYHSSLVSNFTSVCHARTPSHCRFLVDVHREERDAEGSPLS